MARLGIRHADHVARDLDDAGEASRFFLSRDERSDVLHRADEAGVLVGERIDRGRGVHADPPGRVGRSHDAELLAERAAGLHLALACGRDPVQVIGMDELECASTDGVGGRDLGDVAPLLVDVLQPALDRRPEHSQRQ